MRNRLFKNIGFLTLSQIANYLLPLVTIPYVTRIVGPENFGVIEFVQSTLLYLIVVVNYGFNRTATRQIAANPQDMALVSKVFSEVVVAKMALFAISIVVFLLGVFLVPEFSKNTYIFAVGFPIVLGWAIYPSFLFEGLQKLQVNALADVLIKLMAAILILALITQPEQFYMVPLINGVMQVLVGGLVLWYASKRVNGLVFTRPTTKAVLNQLNEAKYIFFSTFFNTLTNFSTILFGAFLLTPIQLGLYAAAYKLIYVANSFLFRPLQGAFFPFLTAKMTEGFSVFKKVFSQALLSLAMISAVGTIVIIVFARLIIQIVFGQDYIEGEGILRIMAPTLFVGSFIHMFLQQGFLHLKKDKEFMYIVVLGGLLSLFLNYAFITKYGLVGAAFVRVLVDVLTAFFAGFLYYKWSKEYKSV